MVDRSNKRHVVIETMAQAISLHYDTHSQTSCPPISCGVSDIRDADFVVWVQPDGSGGLPVAGQFRVIGYFRSTIIGNALSECSGQLLHLPGKTVENRLGAVAVYFV